MARHSFTLYVALAFVAALAFAAFPLLGQVADATIVRGASAQPVSDPDAVLLSVLRRDPIVVRAGVDEVISDWSADRSYLWSRSRLASRYELRGHFDMDRSIHTIGGYLPDLELYMMTPEMPNLSKGEEVILFLAPDSQGYRIVGDLAGKYTIIGDEVQYGGLLFSESLEQFYARLLRLDAGLTLPDDWGAREAMLEHNPVVGGLDYVYKGMKWPTNRVEFRVNLNSAQMDGQNGEEEDFREAILDAAATWSDVEGADFSLIYTGTTNTVGSVYNLSNDIYFEDRGEVDESGARRPLATATVWFSNGEILDADIWINDAYPWDATGAPTWAEIDLESVVLHELGHWLALGHDPDSRAVMYYAIVSGTLKRALFANDLAGIEYIYPCAAGAECNPEATATNTPTVTPTPTATPTATATPSPSPTATPTQTPELVAVTREDGGSIQFQASVSSSIHLLVPPHAVISDTLIGIERVAVAPPLPERHTPLLGFFRVVVGPSGQDEEPYRFAEPITLTVSYTPSVRAEMVRFLVVDPTEYAWVRLPCGLADVEATETHTVVRLCQTATFGVFQEQRALFLPVVKYD